MQTMQNSAVQPTDSWTRIVSRANSHDKDRDNVGDVGERIMMDRSSTEFGNCNAVLEDANNMIMNNRMLSRGSKQLVVSDNHRGGVIACGRKPLPPQQQQHQSLGPQWSNSSDAPTQKNTQKHAITAAASTGQEKRSFFDA